MCSRPLIVLCLASALAGSIAEAAAPPGLSPPPNGAETSLATDLTLLSDAGVKADGPALVEFFRKQTLSDERRREIGVMIQQLGDDNFEVRESASRKLLAEGAAAVTALERALKHRDLEISHRAKRCLGAIDSAHAAELRAAAARVLIVRRPAGGVEVLLAFLPDTAGAAEEDRIVAALTALGVREGKVDGALLAALTDRLPLLRAIAAEVLAAIGKAEHRPAVRKLLADAHKGVRLHVATALISVGDREAVPALIDAAAEMSPAQTREARELLRLLAGARAPRAEPGGEAATRKPYRDQWHAWWKEHGATADLARVEAGPASKVKVEARASATGHKDYTPDKAFAASALNGWAAGDYAPQWIEADTGAPHRLADLRLNPSQLPVVCDTTHEVWVADEPIGEDRTKARLVHTFKGRTENGRPMTFDFPKGLTARYVQIRTTASESWVSWNRIELQVGRTRSRFVNDEGE
jgi:hypothetical protein